MENLSPDSDKCWYRVDFHNDVYCFVDVLAENAQEAQRIAEDASESDCLHIDVDSHWQFEQVNEIPQGDVAQPYPSDTFF